MNRMLREYRVGWRLSTIGLRKLLQFVETDHPPVAPRNVQPSKTALGLV